MDASRPPRVFSWREPTRERQRLTAGHRSASRPATARSQRSSVVMRIELTLLAVLCCGAAGCLSAPRCLDAQATEKIYDAAWDNQVSTMRELLERDRQLAQATGCRSQPSASRTALQSRMSGLTTPLHVAARQGHPEVARLLLENGAQVDARSGDESTPLHLAAQYGHDAVIKVLIAGHAT